MIFFKNNNKHYGFELPVYFWKVLFFIVLTQILSGIITLFLGYFTNIQIPNAVFNSLSWILLCLLIVWLFSTKKFVLLKVFVVIFFTKWLYYAMVFGLFEHRKDIMIMPLLLVSTTETKFREVIFVFFDKYKYKLLVLFLLSFLPFIGSSQINIAKSGNMMFRVGGIWDNSKQIAWFLIAFMMILPRKKIALHSFIFFSILITGTRTGILAASFFLLYLVLYNYTLLSQKKLVSNIFFSIIVLVSVASFLTLSPDNKYTTALVENMAPVFKEDISSDSYGSGRGLLARLAMEGIYEFDGISLLVGKSFESLGDIYEPFFGSRPWPHNDFLMVMWCYGFFGIIIYTYYLFVYPILVMGQTDYKRFMAIIITIFLLAIGAGFSTYSAKYIILLTYGFIYEENRRLSCYIQ